MTELEAYPCGRSYGARAAARYARNALVRIGPAYMMGGTYATDWCAGKLARVLRSVGPEPTIDYAVVFVRDATCQAPETDDDADAFIHPSRLTEAAP